MRLISPSVAILRTQSDERLVALAREGHEAAFTAIVERYRRPMLTAARRFLPDARAEDAVQQIFVAAWNGLRRGDDVRDLRPWLYRIARNTSLNALRAPGYDVVELQESLRFGEAPQDELERREAVRRTLAGLAALPERQREALLRTAVEGTAHADVARDLGLSEGAARQLVMRARTTLRSAASAVLPLPVLQWLVTSAGPTATLAKAGAVVAVASATVATPVVVVEEARRQERAPAVARAAEAKPTPTRAAAVPTPAATVAAPSAPARRKRPASTSTAIPVPTRTSNRGPGSVSPSGEEERSGSNSGSGSSGSSGSSSSSGPGSGDDLTELEDDSSGSGSGHD
jgi:RNA polymerase sigma factor (sigma-70 family)